MPCIKHGLSSTASAHSCLPDRQWYWCCRGRMPLRKIVSSWGPRIPRKPMQARSGKRTGPTSSSTPFMGPTLRTPRRSRSGTSSPAWRSSARRAVTLPVTLGCVRIGGRALMFSVLLSACAAPPHPIPPIPAPRAPLGHPARDAQSRLLQEAHRAFAQERYRAAGLFFHRFTDDAPDTPRLAEARWWLGRAYEQMGDYPAAMEQYRAIAAGMEKEQQDGALYEEQALRRLDELRQSHAEQPAGRSSQLALGLRINQL